MPISPARTSSRAGEQKAAGQPRRGTAAVVNNAAGSVTSSFATLASVDIKMFAGVIVNGPLGSNYLIQASANLLNGWTTLTNVALPTQPYIYIDYRSPTNSAQPVHR